jgi:hypothetical protein
MDSTFPGENLPNSEPDHSSPSIPKVKNERKYTAASSICFHGVHKSKFTFI